MQFSITIKLTDIDASIKPGFSATASIITNQVTNVLMVPTATIQKGQNRSILLIKGTNGNPTIVPVELGAASDSMTQVISDQIAEGDVILVPVSNGNMTNLRSGFGMYGILGGEPRCTSTWQRWKFPACQVIREPAMQQMLSSCGLHKTYQMGGCRHHAARSFNGSE